MGVLLSCLRFSDHEDERDNASGIGSAHSQSFVGSNFARKCEEVLRNHARENQPMSDSNGANPSSDFINDLLQSSKTLSTASPSKLKIHEGYFADISEEEDVCPTCFEDYTDQNPRVALQCGHIFHLSCIYEWMERSEACPFCAKMMLFLEP
ncbi:PREDICTED: E3 ubiquitin-protein ligase At3g02290 [Tarenaya hassleriana]|uniref:E3 ubiquitin-protein ligase At3g02290 n=1 Tax=Tarenaya hassleriana TaxID=28532 RepID=UPI00053CA839|nr:PREDICTED: E3 ubiquitin-protein ligase At3g02290 [Tarenaya hassleriana]XP_010551358.1 PREDICTED: E3 ubiquitin-protein ligase At3g02290 [Tarenaya hassleriana]